MSIDPEPHNHTESHIDFYALIEVPQLFSPEELSRAKRKGALKFHPDRAVKPDASDSEKDRAREKWNLFEVGLKLLGDPTLRAKYDHARSSREQKKHRDSKRDADRQAMLDRLEKREGGTKRSADDMMNGGGNAEERELRRLAGDGARAREALMAKRRAMAMEVAKEEEEAAQKSEVPAGEGSEKENRPLRSSRDPRDFLNSPRASPKPAAEMDPEVRKGKGRSVPSFGSFKPAERSAGAEGRGRAAPSFGSFFKSATTGQRSDT